MIEQAGLQRLRVEQCGSQGHLLHAGAVLQTCVVASARDLMEPCVDAVVCTCRMASGSQCWHLPSGWPVHLSFTESTGARRCTCTRPDAAAFCCVLTRLHPLVQPLSGAVAIHPPTRRWVFCVCVQGQTLLISVGRSAARPPTPSLSCTTAKKVAPLSLAACCWPGLRSCVVVVACVWVCAYKAKP